MVGGFLGGGGGAGRGFPSMSPVACPISRLVSGLCKGQLMLCILHSPLRSPKAPHRRHVPCGRLLVAGRRNIGGWGGWGLKVDAAGCPIFDSVGRTCVSSMILDSFSPRSLYISTTNCFRPPHQTIKPWMHLGLGLSIFRALRGLGAGPETSLSYRPTAFVLYCIVVYHFGAGESANQQHVFLSLEHS